MKICFELSMKVLVLVVKYNCRAGFMASVVFLALKRSENDRDLNNYQKNINKTALAKCDHALHRTAPLSTWGTPDRGSTHFLSMRS